MRERRAGRRRAGKSIQDYVVVPEQLWLDGVAAGGDDVLVGGGIQIEITPARRRAVPAGMQIFVRTLTGQTISVVCGPDYRVSDLKNIIRGREGLAPGEQRLVCAGRQLHDDMTLGQCGVQHVST